MTGGGFVSASSDLHGAGSGRGSGHQQSGQQFDPGMGAKVLAQYHRPVTRRSP
jgi:hypothetical protein